MKYAGALLILVAANACAWNAPAPVTSITYQQTQTSVVPEPWPYQFIDTVKLMPEHCDNRDQIIEQIDRQLKLKKIFGVKPETLNSADAQYLQRARSLVWALRIMCTNPGRYAK